MIILLFLAPGFMYFVGFHFLSKYLHKRHVPPAIADSIITLLLLVPTMVLIMSANGYSISNALAWPDDASLVVFLAGSALSLVWAVFVFGFGSTIDKRIYSKWFKKWPKHLDLVEHIHNTNKYSPNMFIYTWSLSLIANSIAAPIIEELYFRGFLLKEVTGSAILVIGLNSLLFAIYHFWSPWQIITRFFAMLPMIWFVYTTGNLYISIVVHLLLNLVGDSISSVPLLINSIRSKRP